MSGKRNATNKYFNNNNKENYYEKVIQDFEEKIRIQVYLNLIIRNKNLRKSYPKMNPKRIMK